MVRMNPTWKKELTGPPNWHESRKSVKRSFGSAILRTVEEFRWCERTYSHMFTHKYQALELFHPMWSVGVLSGRLPAAVY